MTTFTDWKNSLEKDISLRFIKERQMAAYSFFLYKNFKEDTNTCYLRSELIEKLVFFLKEEYDGEEEEEYNNPNIVDDYRAKARKWVMSWSSKDVYYLEEFKDEKGEIMVKPSLYLMRVFQWIDSILTEKEFISTESRLQDIFTKLDKIIASSMPKTAQEQIDDLWVKIDDMMKEIDNLKENKQDYLGLDERKLKEEYNLLLEMMNGLALDFRAVEQKFKTVAKGVQQEQLKKENTKGKTLQYYLDADDEIKKSPQGKSFYGFWRLVNNQKQREHFNLQAAKIFELLKKANIQYNEQELKKFFGKLSREGKEVETVNDQLIIKIRRIISEQQTSDIRALRTIISEIKANLLNKPIENPNIFSFEVESFKAEGLYLPERYTITDTPTEKNVKRVVSDNQNTGIIDITILFDMSIVDMQKLQANITIMLQKFHVFSIETLVHEYPLISVQDALVYLYLALNVKTDNTWDAWVKTDVCVYLPYDNQLLKMPNIYFSRK